MIHIKLWIIVDYNSLFKYFLKPLKLKEFGSIINLVLQLSL